MLINGVVLIVLFCSVLFCSVLFCSVLFCSACFVFCGKLDLLDPPIEKACYYLEEKHVTKSCVARNSNRPSQDLTISIFTPVWFSRRRFFCRAKICPRQLTFLSFFSYKLSRLVPIPNRIMHL